MQWSKLRESIKDILADSVKNRIQFHVTRYGSGSSTTMARAWVTWDKKEIANFSTVEKYKEHFALAREIQKINHCEDFRDPKQREAYYAAYEEAEAILDKKGIFSRFSFYDSLIAYLELSVEEAMGSDNPIIEAVSMLDRRLGKRRLREIDNRSKHPLVKMFFELRCEAEGIKVQAN